MLGSTPLPPIRSNPSNVNVCPKPLFVLVPAFIFWIIFQGTLYQLAFSEHKTAKSQNENDSRFLKEDSKSPSTHEIDYHRLPVIVDPPKSLPDYQEDISYDLHWTYLASEKSWPYVGYPEWVAQFENDFRKKMNSLATFSLANETRMHGIVGLYSNGSRAWQPSPKPPLVSEIPGGEDVAFKEGGFYLNFSAALPMDRDPEDNRAPICKDQKYDIPSLDDVSVIITFYNEYLSTLLRSVHSVLNSTPPPLLREILLIDDHSNSTENLPGSFLYEYIKLLPKTKLLRLPERRGLVWARLAGAKLAKAPVLIILDSHIEVNKGWLEPQLARLKESPKSIVFPQIMSINQDDFTYSNSRGIGCYLSFKWVMQERATFEMNTSPDPVPSPSMAGGLFAVYKHWFWELGGYDEEFCMWGAENVEMGLRTWMCGGRLECTPCSRVYHIFRKKGQAYSSPVECLEKNRMRTARLWLDEFYQLTAKVISPKEQNIGPLDAMLELKERLSCKNFSWFAKHIDPGLGVKSLDDIILAGEIRNVHDNMRCLDTLSHSNPGESFGVFHCHGSGGTQAFMCFRFGTKIHLLTDESKCLGRDLKIYESHNEKNCGHFDMSDDLLIRWKTKSGEEECMGLFDQSELRFVPCDPANKQLLWKKEKFQVDPNFKLPDFSEEYKIKRQLILEKQKKNVNSI